MFYFKISWDITCNNLYKQKFTCTKSRGALSGTDFQDRTFFDYEIYVKHFDDDEDEFHFWKYIY